MKYDCIKYDYVVAISIEVLEYERATGYPL